MSSGDLLWACRAVGRTLRVIGADVVEVSPTGIGSGDITALVAARAVHELLTGIAASKEAARIATMITPTPRAPAPGRG